MTSEKCVLGTQGSTKPFNLPPGYVYFDREGRNSTDPAAFGVVDASSSATGNATPTNTVALMAVTSSSTGSCDTCNETAVGAGVGVTLGVMLLVALTLLIWQWRRSRALQKQLAEMETQHNSAPGETSQPYKDRPHGGWGESISGAVSPAPAYVDQRKVEAPGDTIREANAAGGPGELPATQQVIPELGN